MASPTDITDAIEALAVHCRPPLMDVNARSLWLRDWCEDLQSFPIDAIRSAAKVWRHGESSKFPTPGQFLALVKAQLPAPAAPTRGEGDTAWRWPSDEELRGMSLRERRRQYLIMASETRGKVGPMNDKGEYPRPQFLAEARGYRDEAIRCAELIAKGAQGWAAE